jgi:hypothetical protein
VSAHPMELIAAYGEGIDRERAETVDRHIADCDSCRTYARQMERVDALISRREAIAPLPAWQPVPRQRRGGVAVFVAIAAALMLLVTVSVVRERMGERAASSPSSTVNRAAAFLDACAVLAPGAVRVGLAQSPEQRPRRVSTDIQTTSGVVPSIFPTICRHGGPEQRWSDASLLLMRRDGGIDAADMLARAFGGPGSPDVVDDWVATQTDMPRAQMWVGHGRSDGGSDPWWAVAVIVDRYGYVVTHASRDTATRLAAVAYEELVSPGACILIARAAAAAGLPEGSYFGHVDMPLPFAAPTSWKTCSYGEDEAWHGPHLFLRSQPTSREEAEQLLAQVLTQDITFPAERLAPWTALESGTWLTRGRVRLSAGLNAPAQVVDWSGVAVSDGSHFFVVTAATDELALRLARAVSAELARVP